MRGFDMLTHCGMITKIKTINPFITPHSSSCIVCGENATGPLSQLCSIHQRTVYYNYTSVVYNSVTRTIDCSTAAVLHTGARELSLRVTASVYPLTHISPFSFPSAPCKNCSTLCFYKLSFYSFRFYT